MENRSYMAIIILISVGMVFVSSSFASDQFYDYFYLSAVFNAEYPTQGDIYNNLTPISESNTNLSWQGAGDDKRVLMVTWTKYSSSYPVGRSVNTSWGDTWVTVYPELINYFKLHPVVNGTQKIAVAQLLGMSPNSNNTYFVELWVKPSDLFRPSADNEINDTTSQLNFPPGTSLSYKEWFLNNTINSYFIKKQPWTRLGYTYHWENPDTRVGLSEYVIRKNSEVIVESKAKTTDYLNH